jgi:multidrug efflux system membrane fusion protein
MKADHSVELRPVTIGRVAGDFTSIATGIEAGENVVTDGQLRLIPGSHVEVRSLEDMTKEALPQNK